MTTATKHMPTPKPYHVKRSANGRQWDIVSKSGKIIEGGFFYRDSALDKLAEWNGELTPRGGPGVA